MNFKLYPGFDIGCHDVDEFRIFYDSITGTYNMYLESLYRKGELIKHGMSSCELGEIMAQEIEKVIANTTRKKKEVSKDT